MKGTTQTHDENEKAQERHSELAHAPRGGAGRFFFLVLLAAAACFAVYHFSIAPRLALRESVARAQAEKAAPRTVRVAVVGRGQAKSTIQLPATVAPKETTQLYARAAGYLRRNLVDVGDAVKAGQLLAEIDAPETAEDRRLAAAQLEEARENLTIVQGTASRNEKLAGAGVVAQQAADDARAKANSAQAALKTKQAEVQRLGALFAYQRVTAPFDGIITRRGADRGALVSAGSAGGVPLFEISQVQVLRVLVDVPQWLARDVKTGLSAEVFAPSAPNQVAVGKVARSSGVLDMATRTLRAEVEVQGDGKLLPGAFVYTRFTVERSEAPMLIPASALVVRKEGTMVAKVIGGKVQLAPIELGRDLGKELEVLRGVALGDKVVMNPMDDLADGMPVTEVAADAGP